jgi:hypothetical protein
MKILLSITSIGAGGAHRVVTLLADSFAGRGHQVALITIDSTTGDFFRVTNKVQRCALGSHRPSRTSLTRWYGNLKIPAATG